GAVTVGLHVVIEGEALALNHHSGQLGERLNEVAVVQFDMASKLQRTASARVIVIALGAGTVAHADLGIVAKAVEFEYAIKV
nr:hypothetical protein [Tanacetum cinerariifolium]